MNEKLNNEIEKLKSNFPDSFINCYNELILIPRINLYFRLEDVNTALQLKCKILAWCSRSAGKIESKYWKKKIKEALNEYFSVSYSYSDWWVVYTDLGNDCKRELSIELIENEMDITILPSYGLFKNQDLDLKGAVKEEVFYKIKQMKKNDRLKGE